MLKAELQGRLDLIEALLELLPVEEVGRACAGLGTLASQLGADGQRTSFIRTTTTRPPWLRGCLAGGGVGVLSDGEAAAAALEATSGTDDAARAAAAVVAAAAAAAALVLQQLGRACHASRTGRSAGAGASSHAGGASASGAPPAGRGPARGGLRAVG